MIRPASFILSTGFAIILAGCAGVPASSNVVQKDVSTRSGLDTAWPHTVAEKQQTDEKVNALLKRELTPDTAAAVALLNNRRLRATFETIGISEADFLAATRLPNPSFSASVRWPDKQPRPPNVEFNLSFEVLNALFIPVRKKLAGEHLAIAQKQVAHEALALMADAKKAAYAIQAREEFRNRMAAILSVNQAAVNFAQRQFDAGNISRLDLLNQQSAMQEAQLELARTDAALQDDREKLNRLLGLSGDEINWQMTPGLPTPPEQETKSDSLEQTAIAQRLDLAAAESEVAAARSALAFKQTTRFLPIDATLGIDTEREPGGTGGHTHVTGPNVELALPVFNQGQADIARLSSDLRRAEANYEALAVDVQSEVRAARAALVAARTAAEYYDATIVPQRRAVSKETLLQYNAMQRSNYELLFAKQQELEAERGRIEAWRDYWLARVELERAVGGQLVVP
ncbi:MAG TPA: TolC family protein [Opitutaceae bacterium]|nr:TolC family protein [Opitutaceae bacterium]